MIKNKTKMSTFSTSTCIMLGGLAVAVRQGKEIQSNPIGKEVVKMSSIADNIIVYIENSMEVQKSRANKWV